MEAAIIKIDRRVADLEAFNPSSMRDRADPELHALQQRLKSLVQDIFGHGSVEYGQYVNSVSRLDTAGYRANGPTPMHEVIDAVQKSKARSLATLRTIKADFEEKLTDAGRGVTTKPIRAYEGLDLHKSIERAAGKLYRDGHYANAVEDAVKALNALVRLNSGVEDRDGVSLMEFVFSVKNPVLKFNPLSTDSDREEQKGFMMMFCGAVSGLRNPRAHTIITDDAERALEFIGFISLLAKLCDDAQKA